VTPKDRDVELDDEQKRMNLEMALAVRDALIRHKQTGHPIATWQNGKVVWIPPEEIVIEDLPSEPGA
jgi:hypothetical protein